MDTGGFFENMYSGLNKEGQAVVDNFRMKGMDKHLDNAQSIIDDLLKKEIISKENAGAISFTSGNLSGVEKIVANFSPETQKALKPYFSAQLDMVNQYGNNAVDALNELHQKEYITSETLNEAKKRLEINMTADRETVSRLGVNEFVIPQQAKATPETTETKPVEPKPDTTANHESNPTEAKPSATANPKPKPTETKPAATATSLENAEKAEGSWLAKLGKNHGGKIAVGVVATGAAVAYVMSKRNENKEADKPR